MTQNASPLSAIYDALPALQAELRSELAERIAAGEMVARVEGGKIIATERPSCDLGDRHKKLVKKSTARFAIAESPKHQALA